MYLNAPSSITNMQQLAAYLFQVACDSEGQFAGIVLFRAYHQFQGYIVGQPGHKYGAITITTYNQGSPTENKYCSYDGILYTS